MAIAGKVSIVPRGEWQSTAVYTKLDLVTFNYNVYLALKESVGIEPTNEEYFMLLIENVVAGNLEDLQNQIDEIILGEISVGNSDNSNNLGNQPSSYYATAQSVEDIVSGAMSVGNAENSAKLGNETAEEWQTKLDNIQSTSKGDLTQSGWYRVAYYYPINISIFGSSSNACEITIKRNFSNNSPETHKLLLLAKFKHYEIHSLYSISDSQLFTQARVTIDSETAYIEVFYASTTSNAVCVTIGNVKDYHSCWKAITPTLTSETVEGVTVVTTYNIPSNARPVTTVDKPSGSYIGNGDATERVINTGGIGSTCIIHSANYSVLLFSNGGIFKDANNETILGFKHTEARFANGKIIYNTNSMVLNASGIEYTYDVL